MSSACTVRLGISSRRLGVSFERVVRRAAGMIVNVAGRSLTFTPVRLARATVVLFATTSDVPLAKSLSPSYGQLGRTRITSGSPTIRELPAFVSLLQAVRREPWFPHRSDSKRSGISV
jgi:hypothetical protein